METQLMRPVALALAAMLLLSACQIVSESDASKERKAEASWWDEFYGRKTDSFYGSNHGDGGDSCNFWGSECGTAKTTNELGW